MWVLLRTLLAVIFNPIQKDWQEEKDELNQTLPVFCSAPGLKFLHFNEKRPLEQRPGKKIAPFISLLPTKQNFCFFSKNCVF